MSTLPTISENHSYETSLPPGRMLRASLPLLSAFGYAASLTALMIRIFDGDKGISHEGVKYFFMASATPLAIAASITGVDAVKQLCTNGYKEAKRIIVESVKPEGLIRRTLLPSKEIEIILISVEEMDRAQASR